MNCSKAHEKLNALIDRELGIKDWVSIRLHLISCKGCRQRLHEYRRLHQVSKTLRSISKRRTIHVAPILAAAFLIMVAMIVFLPKPKRPQALVYDESFLSGKAMPVSAIYSEGDHLVVRDPKSGFALARASGHTRKDAFFAISAANRMPASQPKEFVIEGPEIELNVGPKGSADIVLLVGDPDNPESQEQTIVFFTGDGAMLRKVKLPSKAPAYFVKVIDPDFLSGLDSDQPFKKYVSPSNNRPAPINR